MNESSLFENKLKQIFMNTDETKLTNIIPNIQLNQYFSEIQKHLEKSEELPILINPRNIKNFVEKLKYEPGIINGKIVIITSIPIVRNATLDMFKPIPIPSPFNNKTFLIIQQQNTS